MNRIIGKDEPNMFPRLKEIYIQEKLVFLG